MSGGLSRRRETVPSSVLGQQSAHLADLAASHGPTVFLIWVTAAAVLMTVALAYTSSRRP